MKYLLVLTMAIMLSACGNEISRDDYLPYLVTSVGYKLELTYVGKDDMIPKAAHVLSRGVYDRKSCTLRTSKVVAKGNGSCPHQSELVLGNVLRIHTSKIDGDGYYKGSYIDSLQSGWVNTERLLDAASIANSNGAIGSVNTRIDGLSTLIQVVDKKVDENMDMTVAAVGVVNQKVNANGDQIEVVMKDVDANKKVIANANRKYAEGKNKSTKLKSKPLAPAVVIKSTSTNRFDFLDK
jgi:hypothetical protein